MADKKRIGIMSFAHLHAEAYIGNLRANPHVDFIGIADEDIARGKHFAQRFNAPLYPSYEAMLADQPDGVIVCSENTRHRPLVELSARAGVHVLCEKPLATTVEDARAMVDICQQSGVQLMIAFPMRFSAPLREVKTLLASGKTGTVYGVNATNQGECPKHHRAWFVDKALSGGGAAMDHIVHLADVMRWYFELEVSEVYARFNHILYAEETDVETGGIAMLTFENGTFVSVDFSWSKPPYYPTWGGLAFELVTENGLITVNAFKQAMTVYQHTLQRPAYGYWGSDANQLMVDEFVNTLRENRAPFVTGHDGLKAVEIVSAAYESAQSGQPVKLK